MEGHRLRSWLVACAAAMPLLTFALASEAVAMEPPEYAKPGAEFASNCNPGRVAEDDPIVFPGRVGASHMHLFFGNNGINAYSTYDSLRAEPAIGTPWGWAATTCVKRPEDKSAYWAPLAYSDGQPPYLQFPYVTEASAYYKTGGKDPWTLRAFPPGLKVVAGHPHGTRVRGEPDHIVSWTCVDYGVETPRSSTVPECQGGRLSMLIRFPDCWDGRSLDGQEHRKHMAYARRKARRRYLKCPASHPVPLPALSLDVTYYFKNGVHGTLQLSSGPPQTAHADFFNAWDQPELERLIKVCIQGRRLCGGRRIS